MDVSKVIAEAFSCVCLHTQLLHEFPYVHGLVFCTYQKLASQLPKLRGSGRSKMNAMHTHTHIYAFVYIDLYKHQLAIWGHVVDQ